MSAIADRLETLLADQPKNPLRPDQVQAYREELDRLDRSAKGGWDKTGAQVEAHRRLTRALETQAPKAIEDEARRDEVAKLTRTLFAEEILPTLQAQEIMRRNPAGAVDHFRKGEGSKAVKRKILIWKRGMRALEPENDDRDYTNLERFRPALAMPDAASTFMAGAQIPGIFAMTPAAKAHWPLGEPTVKTALDGAGYVPTDAPVAAAETSPAAIAEAFVARVCQYRKCGKTFMARKDDHRELGRLYCERPARCAQRERVLRSGDKAKARTAAEKARQVVAATAQVPTMTDMTPES